jgi:hypothetical protein
MFKSAIASQQCYLRLDGHGLTVKVIVRAAINIHMRPQGMYKYAPGQPFCIIAEMLLLCSGRTFTNK